MYNSVRSINNSAKDTLKTIIRESEKTLDKLEYFDKMDNAKSATYRCNCWFEGTERFIWIAEINLVVINNNDTLHYTIAKKYFSVSETPHELLLKLKDFAFEYDCFIVDFNPDEWEIVHATHYCYWRKKR